MRLDIFTEPQLGATYDDQVRMARHAEELGFDGFFRSDHYVTMGSADGMPGPTDSWLTLAALARETSRIRLGTLVSSATFRLPGILAMSVAQVDQMSGGRVELGLGAGWYEIEHTAYGIPFPAVGERFDRLTEQLEIITGLWSTPDGETFSFSGKHYDLADSPALPKPVQRPGPPIIVGGRGKRRTPELAARFADEYNVGFSSIEETAASYANGDRACEAVGRSRPLARSIAHPTFCGRTDAEVRERVERAGGSMDHLRERGLVGTPAEVVDRLGAYADLGATRAYLQIVDMTDLDHVELIATEVLPRVA
ncbi:MAG TPA: LLM class F420-dependent oxidoreductase [Micromonosporaceae bacterium]|nr:LLM class F420-dependent oxidoreductase [Micromonosporaceae bacterium]